MMAHTSPAARQLQEVPASGSSTAVAVRVVAVAAAPPAASSAGVG